MSETTNARYDGKPLLRLLECYVLASIGELNVEQRRLLDGMTPKLREVYGVDGTWAEIISAVMRLGPSVEETIQELWRRDVILARTQGIQPDPEGFARQVVDTKLAPIQRT